MRIGRSVRIAAIAALGLALAACADNPPVSPLAEADIPPPSETFAFLEITNTPAEQVTELSEALAEEAESRELTLVKSDDPTADYRVQGYLSAVSGASGTILVYVFDVLDPVGTRVHRISGQEISPNTAPDPWLGVSSGTLRIAAQRIIDSLYAWVRRG
jgi:hypothetical protein